MEPDGENRNEPRAKRAQGGRWRVARFVASFITLTAALLVGYHYLQGGPAMDRYIFEVARHTVWILDLAGESCRFSGPKLAQGNEAAMRAALEAWPEGREVEPGDVAEQPDAPLTAWEAWSFRAAERRWVMRRIEAYVARLEAVETPGRISSYEEHRELVERRAELLEATMAARNPATTQNLTGREARRAIKELRRRLEDVPQETPDENLAQHGAALTELLSWAENLREIRIQELRDRLVKRRAMAGSWGPRVKLVWSSQAGTADVGQAAADSEDPPKPKRFTFSIVPDCGALEAIAIFVAAVLVFPASFVKRLIGIALGVPLLYLVNLGRLTCLAVIGALTPGAQWFDFSHKYVWQGVYVIFVVVFWLLWVEFIVGRKKSE